MSSKNGYGNTISKLRPVALAQEGSGAKIAARAAGAIGDSNKFAGEKDPVSRMG